MARIVILGGSFGGLTAAFKLKRLLGKRAEVTVVSDDEKFVFVPSLAFTGLETGLGYNFVRKAHLGA